MKAKKTAAPEPQKSAPRLIATSPKAFVRLCRAHDDWIVVAVDSAEAMAIDADEITNRAGRYELRSRDGEVMATTVVGDDVIESKPGSMGADHILAKSVSAANSAALDTMRASVIDLTKRLEKEQARYEKLEVANEQLASAVMKLRDELATTKTTDEKSELLLQGLLTGKAAFEAWTSKSFREQLFDRARRLIEQHADAFSEEERDAFIKVIQHPALTAPVELVASPKGPT